MSFGHPPYPRFIEHFNKNNGTYRSTSNAISKDTSNLPIATPRKSAPNQIGGDFLVHLRKRGYSRKEDEEGFQECQSAQMGTGRCDLTQIGSHFRIPNKDSWRLQTKRILSISWSTFQFGVQNFTWAWRTPVKSGPGFPEWSIGWCLPIIPVSMNSFTISIVSESVHDSQEILPGLLADDFLENIAEPICCPTVQVTTANQILPTPLFF